MGRPNITLPVELGSRYRLERELGSGAMATVYLALDILHRREVAIKIIRPDLAPILGPERFLREIRIASQMTHPHILPLLDSGDQDGHLYYVMPVAHGDTLRSRLDRDRQLSLPDALQITRDVAEALQYADQHGIVHRDIKPENILLEDGRALVADFGIARVTDAVGDSRLSSSGIAVGTPDYMSPEQASADRSVDGRSDIYSLGCVLYEMLVGERPFSGPSHKVIAMRHMMEKVPSLRLARPDLPLWVEGVVEKALAKTPADRYADGSELIAAIERGPDLPALRARRSRWPWVAAGLLLLSAAIPANRWVQRYFENRGIEPERLVVLPFRHRQMAAPHLLTGEISAALISESLRRWRDVPRVEELRASDALQRYGGGPGSLQTAYAVARSLGAGQLLWGEVYEQGGKIRARGVLYDVRHRDSVVRDSIIELQGEDDPALASGFQALADFLVSGGRPFPSPHAPHPLATTRAFAAGMVALNTWDLETAKQEFSRSLKGDPGYAPANLHMALVSQWLDEPSEDWRAYASRAAGTGQGLSPGDANHAAAILALAEHRYQDACERYRRMLRRDSTSFAGWFGLGDCQWLDDQVLPDSRSVTGFRFRSSYQAAGEAFRRALELAPSAHRAMEQMLSFRLQNVMPSTPGHYRPGQRSGLAVGEYVAFAGLDHDTLTFDPIPVARLTSSAASPVPSSHLIALEHNRAQLDELTERWTRVFPLSPAAWEARGLALERAGLLTDAKDRSALGAIRKSRRLATDSTDMLRRTLDEIRIHLKMADFSAARRLADSMLLRFNNPGRHMALDMLPIAGLVGKRRLMLVLAELGAPVRVLHSPDGGMIQPSAIAAVPALKLFSYSLLGGSQDSVAVLERRIESMVAATADPRARARLRQALLAPAAEFGFPLYGHRPIHDAPGGDYLLHLQSLYSRSDVPGLKRALADLDHLRRGPPPVLPGQLGLESVYQEAWLRVEVADSAGAVGGLDSALDNLSLQRASSFRDYQGPASLVLAMALRARLAARLGDPLAARRWATAVVALWSGADADVPVNVEAMRLMVSTGRE